MMTMPSSERRVVTAADILKWQRTYSPVLRVKTQQDELPSGLSVAMAPLFVSWLSSSAGFGSDHYYLVRNVNVLNNPVEGITLLGTVKVWADSVESVEFVMVISKVAGRESPGGHGMLRFTFREDRRPIVLGADGQPFTNDSVLDDIVVSWEAWRPPLSSFDPVAGLDPSTYALTPRCFAGPVRCVADAVLDRPWHCYPLNLPDVENAKNELLYVSLVLADAVARQTSLASSTSNSQGPQHAEDYPDAESKDWENLAEEARRHTPENGSVAFSTGASLPAARALMHAALQSVDWVISDSRGPDWDRRSGSASPESMRPSSPRWQPASARRLSCGCGAALAREQSAVIPARADMDEVGLLRREKVRS
jgi:hypothetical protein